MAKPFFSFVILVLIFCHTISLVSAGYLALMDAETAGEKQGSNSRTVCVTYQPKFSEIPSDLDEANPVTLVDLSDKLGCSPSDFIHAPHNLSGSAVAVSRGVCTFTTKADLAQSVNASSILIIDYKNSSSPPVPAGNSTKDYNEINITVASVAWEDYQDVKALPAPVEVRIYAIKSSHFDPNMIVILLGSTAIIVVGALCTIYTERQKLNSPRSQSHGSKVQRSGSSSSSSSSGGENEDETLQISPLLVFFWVVFLVGILLCLYFFYDYTVYVFIAMFCIAGSHGLFSCLWPAWSRIFPYQQAFRLIKSNIKITELILFMLCLTVGIFWAVQRHASYAWVFQDILGIAFCVYLLRTLRLPSLKIITLLSVLLFCYDVFFVFITPLFTKDGESIMVDVATGGKDSGGNPGSGKAQRREMVPMLFIIPLLGNHPSSACTGRPFSILGFGDVIFPGLLIVFNAVFDVNMKTKMVYFVSTSIGYLIGMTGCLIALVFMESGQPALFYLVPATLIPTFAIALKRGELRAIWTGQMKTESMSKDLVGDNNNSDAVERGVEEIDEFSDDEQSPLTNQ